MPKGLGTIIPFIFMIVILYAVILIPEKKRKTKYKSMLDNLKVNDEIITRGGIVGKIERIHEDFFIISTGPDKVKLKLTRNGVGMVLEKKEEII
ncbi:MULTISPECIES: preprotein translocase subunit YajC [Clostridium]|uniref:Preprotein translocase, YajC subunit n=1 Tax=Clostridium novyi (strain NT) TaxID=386415 RepID=A0PZV7_CLONN|nr:MULTISPECIES: preprotein translocase subunit YajC [Clostridium]ABK61187.1 preprotein translocase, YajC subunit [Clostridium novyi NT]KEH88389.1 preprotein translocase subunit YajC [Clostridium novyi A str. NCTC 538]KEH88732.1 preprotein translocase subunit YajC [Clostridium novyi A str. 4540]KEH94356.1 preprotein translocase subunit YajC [Clostridium botulinum C/D str. It1]KEH95053.1 preprotein translocase subunit YajC [Clostridium novyi A str. GD211209]